MSFRENLQHLRATRNMTQEQLAMLLGVSRQAVYKWEAEKAYPEMDKLLKICSIFDCTLDQLVSGDLTSRAKEGVTSMPSASAPQDVVGYDDTMRRFALKLSLGVVFILLGVGVASLLQGACPFSDVDPDTYSAVALFGGVALGICFILPAAFERSAFQKAHPFIEDFYTGEQKAAARQKLSTGLVIGIVTILAGLCVAALLQNNERIAGFVFFLFVAAGVFLIMYAAIAGARCDVAAYNKEALSDLDDDQIAALGDPTLQAKAHSARNEGAWSGVIMCTATALGLLLLFVPAFHAQEWFWVVWPIGGVLCGAVTAWRRALSGR